MPFANISAGRLALCGALIAVIGACDKSVEPTDDSQNIPESQEPYSRTRVLLDGGGVYPIDGTVVSMRNKDGTEARQIASARRYDTASVYFDNKGTTYNLVTIAKEGFVPSSARTSIWSQDLDMRARIRLVPLSDSQDVESERSLVGTSGTLFLAPIRIRYAIGSTRVTLSKGSTFATVSTLAPSVVPPIYPDDPRADTYAVISAAYVKLDEFPSEATLRVDLPIPVDTSDFAAAEGGQVDAWRFDHDTMRWVSLGTATIGNDGRATVYVAGSELEILVAISQAPDISPRRLLKVDSIALYDISDVAEMVARGDTILETPLDIEVTYAGPTQRDTLSGYEQNATSTYAWDIQLPSIVVKRELHQWWYTGDEVIIRAMNENVAYIYMVDRFSGIYTNTYTFGDVIVSYNVEIDYTYVTVLCCYLDYDRPDVG
jgi:hypothetical protein